MKPQLRLAVWQQPGLCGQPDAMVDRLATLLDSAALADADLLVLPELWTSGYFDATAVASGSEPDDGQWQRRICALAQNHKLALAFGYPEQADGKRYNTVRLIGPDGASLLSYRKVNLWGDYERDLFAAGDTASAIAEFCGWKIGFSICYDTEYGLWLAFANRSGEEHGYRFNGRSAIVGPDGIVRARAETDESLIFATLDAGAIGTARAASPFLGDMRWSAPVLSSQRA